MMIKPEDPPVFNRGPKAAYLWADFLILALKTK